MSRAVARGVCRLVAAAIVIAVSALAAVTVVEVIAAALGGSGVFVDRDAMVERMRTTLWVDDAVRNASLLAGVVGTALLALTLWPRHADTLFTTAGPGVGIRRRDVAHVLRGAAEVDGVHRAHVKIKGDRGRIVDVTARSHRTQADDIEDRVRDAVRAESDRLSLSTDVRVAVQRDRAAQTSGEAS